MKNDTKSIPGKAVLLGVAVIIAAFLLRGVATAANGFSMDNWGFTGGGGETETGQYSLAGSAGQAIAGEVSAAGYEVSSGYQAGPEPTVEPTTEPTPEPTATMPTPQEHLWMPLVLGE